MKCPNCGRINDSSALTCDCGYALVEVTVAKTSSKDVDKARTGPKIGTMKVASAEADDTKDGGKASTEVVIVNFDMPFMSIVFLLVKVALAAIPAFLILGFIFFVLTSVFAGSVVALFSQLGR